MIETLCVACRLEHRRVLADFQVPIMVDGEHGVVNVCQSHADNPEDSFWGDYPPYHADESMTHA